MRSNKMDVYQRIIRDLHKVPAGGKKPQAPAMPKPVMDPDMDEMDSMDPMEKEKKLAMNKKLHAMKD